MKGEYQNKSKAKVRKQRNILKVWCQEQGSDDERDTKLKSSLMFHLTWRAFRPAVWFNHEDSSENKEEAKGEVVSVRCGLFF